MNKWIKVALILFVLCLLFIPAMFLLKTVAILQIYSHYVDSVANLTGINRYLVKTAVILMLIPFLMGIRWYFFSIGNKRRKYTGAALVVAILVIYNLGLYGVTKNSYFDFSEGKVSKWYASTPEGIRFFDAPGYDPKYGVTLKPVTPKVIANLEKKKRRMQPNRLVFDSLDQIELFDRITGENRVWYYKDSAGSYELFDGPGIHPTYGESLKPVTRQVILRLKGQAEERAEKRKKEAKRLGAKKPNRLVFDSLDKIELFDRITGENRVWYYKDSAGSYELFDGPGIHPTYGESLKPVTRQVILRLKGQAEERAEKRKKEAKRLGAKKPNRLVFDSLDKIEIFDQITGENKVWYYKYSAGNYEFFDGPGIHPTYGESLNPVTQLMLLQIKGRVEEKAERKQKEAERLRIKKAAKQREAYLNRYLLSRSFFNQPNSTEVAILVIDETGKMAQNIDQDIASQLTKKGFNATASFFSGPFVADGIFKKLFNGNPAEVKKLRLSKHCDQIVLGKSSANFTRNPDLENMITARVSTEFRIISTKTGAVENRFTLSETGVGFSKAAAAELAIERIVNGFEIKAFNSEP